MHTKKPPRAGAIFMTHKVNIRALHDALGRIVVVVLNAIFVAHYLTIQLVYQFVDGCIQILVCTFGKHGIAFDIDTAFSALATLLFLLVFYREKHFDIHYLIKVPHDSI